MAPSGTVKEPSRTVKEPSSDFKNLKTRILPIHNLGTAQDFETIQKLWKTCIENHDPEAAYMLEAAEALNHGDIPVAFPTETVYGLGADATRSPAVRGIYQAKQRPLDNPLIVHFSSLEMLNQYLRPEVRQNNNSVNDVGSDGDPMPPIYKPLIERFWPGPLTILLPNPKSSPFAPEVTTMLPSFGARIPSSPLARLLIQLSQTPLAAPSANASGLPSPTTAQHVNSDLAGRIEIILDGGPCGVGLESTVIDGLSDPPVVLRPGGVGIEEIRSIEGWENTRIGYKDHNDGGEEDAPRAPGMKYRHYAPRAQCILFEAGQPLRESNIAEYLATFKSAGKARSIGVVRTKHWLPGLGGPQQVNDEKETILNGINGFHGNVTNGEHKSPNGFLSRRSLFEPTYLSPEFLRSPSSIWDVNLGRDLQNIARGLFSALRALDEKDVDIILVEGISDSEGDLAAAIMNRLRKACAGG